VLRLANINIDDLEIRGIWGSKKKAEFLIESYHSRYQEIRGIWHPRIKTQVRSTRIIHDAFGRKRLFLDRMDEDLFRKAFAQRPQASVVTIANIGVRRLVAAGYRVIAQVHDSIVIEFPEDQEGPAMQALNNAMTTEITNWGGTFTIPVELKVGHSWGDLKEVHLEDYLGSTPDGQDNGLLGGVQ
jgi:DNA polymerase I-like protein with 3'-5' exonuclease and polymerase domains